jgi:hypothetical protein
MIPTVPNPMVFQDFSTFKKLLMHCSSLKNEKRMGGSKRSKISLALKMGILGMDVMWPKVREKLLLNWQQNQ